MSVVERALSTIKDLILLREQMKEMRDDMSGLGDDVASLVGDIRSLEQRIARLEGASDAMRLLTARPARLPRK